MLEREFLRKIAWGLAIVLLCSGRTLRGQAQAVAESSLTQINLQKFGWQPPPRISPGERSWTGRRIAIDHKERVLVCFTEREPGEGLSHRPDAGISLRILRFTADGKTDLSLALPTDNWTGYGVYLDATDDIIARADEWLQILIPNGKTRPKQNRWKPLAPCGPTCEVRQSPSRRTLYLSDTGVFERRVTIITGKHLGKLRNCEAPQDAVLSITDAFAYSSSVSTYYPQPIDFTYRWPLCDPDPSQQTRLPVSGSLTPISDNALLGDSLHRGSNKRYVIYGADGKVKNSFLLRLAKHEGAGLGSTWVPERSEGISENGERLAFIGFTQRGGIAWLDIGSHLTAQRVIVLDVATGEQLASIPVSHPTHFLETTISPDGRRVAFLVNGTLTIADVP